MIKLNVQSVAAATTCLIMLIGCSNMDSFKQASSDSSAVAMGSAAKGENPFTCDPAKDPAQDKLRRLNKREYTATLQDLLGSTVAMASLQAELDQVDREAKTLELMFDTSNSAPINLKLIRAYSAVAAKIADLVSADSVKMNALAGNSCISMATVSDLCLDGFLESFGYRSYRRPLTGAEKTLYRTLYRTGISNKDAFARVVESLLQAPSFLYHLTDQGTPIDGRSDLLSLSAHEVASRLSYLILGSMPDAELFAAARSGALVTVAQIRTQTERLALLPRAREHTREFLLQWFDVKDLPAMSVAPELTLDVDVEQFLSEAKQEMGELIDDVVWRQKGGLDQLLSTPLVIARGPALSTIYGVSPSTVPQASPHSHRKGILTRAAFLAGRTGNSSPIHRGVRVRTRLLCDPLGAPPADATTRVSQFDPLSSTRTQITAKTSSGDCMSCHGQINGIGFALENFDGFGRFRKTESVFFKNEQAIHEINTKVMAYINSTSEAEIDGAVELQEAMLATNKASACLTSQYYQFQIGRHASIEDGCDLREMFARLGASNGSAIEMFKSIAGTRFLRLKKID